MIITICFGFGEATPRTRAKFLETSICKMVRRAGNTAVASSPRPDAEDGLGSPPRPVDVSFSSQCITRLDTFLPTYFARPLRRR